MTVRILTGDVFEQLATLPDESVHCVVTSPPYWGLRCYGMDGQIGLEPTLGEHLDVMVRVFAEVWRVMRPDATLWLNYGDCYATQAAGAVDDPARKSTLSNFKTQMKGNEASRKIDNKYKACGLPEKNLMLLPNRLAIALQEWGWWVRSEIVWAKPNPMPESVTDRPTNSHEKIWLLSKSARYWYDADAVRQVRAGDEDNNGFRGGSYVGGQPGPRTNTGNVENTNGANLRNVWNIATRPYSEAHFATFPPEIPERCIKAGTSEKGVCSKCGAPWQRITDVSYKNPGNRKTNGPRSIANTHTTAGYAVRKEKSVTTTGWKPTCRCSAEIAPAVVLDPFGGAGTTGLVADRLNRNAILIELNPEYAEMARNRIAGDAPLLAEVDTDHA